MQLQHKFLHKLKDNKTLIQILKKSDIVKNNVHHNRKNFRLKYFILVEA